MLLQGFWPFILDKVNLSAYKKILSKFFNDNQKSLSKESLDKINTNPLRILDSKNPEDSAIIKKTNIIPLF